MPQTIRVPLGALTGPVPIAQLTPDTAPPYQPRNLLEEGRRSVATGPTRADVEAATPRFSQTHPGFRVTPQSLATLSHDELRQLDQETRINQRPPESAEAPTSLRDRVTGEPVRPTIAAWFERELRPQLEAVAHPQTINDLASLLVPDAYVGGVLKAGAAARDAVIDAVRALPTPTGAQVLKVIKTVRHPVREGIKSFADAVIARLEPAVRGVPPAGVGRVVGKAPTVEASVEAALQELRAAPTQLGTPAARVPEYPQAATDTMRLLEARPPIRARVHSAPVTGEPVAMPQTGGPSAVTPAAPPQLGTPVGRVPPPIAPVASHVRDVNAAPVGAAPAPVPAPGRAPAGAFNPSAALADARAQFATLGETPRPAEVTNAMEYIRRGESAEDAVAHVVRLRRDAPVRTTPAPAVAPPETAAAAAKPAYTAEEVAFGQRLMARGKTEQEAIDAILAQRAFLQVPGTESSATVRAAQDLRNARGQTKTPSAETAARRRR